MNKQLIAERFTKAIATYPQEANVQRHISEQSFRQGDQPKGPFNSWHDLCFVD